MIKKSIVIVLVIGLGLTLLVNSFILSYGSYIVSMDAIPERPMALIFGGGMKSPGVMSDMQTDRVLQGVALYQHGKVHKLMMTGDDGGYVGDEVTFMRQRAIDEGVPAKDILVDPHGYRTYESCYREKNIYGVTSTLVVSQSFHLSRILYLCRGFGIEALGVAADRRGYGWQIWWMNIREALARIKAFWQFEITHPQPMSAEK